MDNGTSWFIHSLNQEVSVKANVINQTKVKVDQGKRYVIGQQLAYKPAKKVQ